MTEYTKPTLERLGTLREITRAGAEFACADGSNPYHRYAACTP